MGVIDEQYELQRAWMAGLLDGDGFLGCYKLNGKYPIYHTQAGVVNLDIRALKIFHSIYGGCLRTRKVESIRKTDEEVFDRYFSLFDYQKRKSRNLSEIFRPNR